jgi:hypothetical protein
MQNFYFSEFGYGRQAFQGYNVSRRNVSILAR